MRTIIRWVTSHQITAFFMAAFAVTWGLGFTYDAVMNQGKDFLMPLAAVATCGPALAGIMVTRICSSERGTESRKTSWIAFQTALVASTFVFVAHNTIVNQAGLSIGLVIFVLIFSVPVAYIISAAYSRDPSVRRYLSSLIRVRQVWRWLLMALAVPAALGVLSIVVSNMLGRQSVHLSDLPFKGLTLVEMATLTFLYQWFFFNGTGEEVGWRGFALPRLQGRTSPLLASLVLTFFWAAWHLFFWMAGGEPVATWQYWQDTLLKLFPATVLIVWLFNRSDGSILVAGFAHASGNTVFQYMPQVDWMVHSSLGYVFVLVVVLTDRMWQRLPMDLTARPVPPPRL